MPRQIHSTFVKRLIPKSGPTSTADYNASAHENAVDHARFVEAWNIDLYPILASLPQGASDTRWDLTNSIWPLANGLDGSQVFVDNSVTSGDYWSITDLRPLTIMEAMTDLHTEIDVLREQLLAGAAGLPPGVATSDTLRWNGTGWEASSFLQNDDVNVFMGTSGNQYAFPTARGASGEVLQLVDAVGTLDWATVTAAAAAPVGSIQFNTASALDGSANLVWDDANSYMTVAGVVIAGVESSRIATYGIQSLIAYKGTSVSKWAPTVNGTIAINGMNMQPANANLTFYALRNEMIASGTLAYNTICPTYNMLSKTGTGNVTVAQGAHSMISWQQGSVTAGGWVTGFQSSYVVPVLSSGSVAAYYGFMTVPHTFAGTGTISTAAGIYLASMDYPASQTKVASSHGILQYSDPVASGNSRNTNIFGGQTVFEGWASTVKPTDPTAQVDIRGNSGSDSLRVVGASGQTILFAEDDSGAIVLSIDNDTATVAFGDGATNYTFPAARGSSGETLQLDGSGVLGWAASAVTAHALGGASHTIDTVANVNALLTGGNIPADAAVTGNTLRWDGSDWVESGALQNSGSTITISSAYALPNVDGTAGQVLTSDGAGTAFWGSHVLQGRQAVGASDGDSWTITFTDIGDTDYVAFISLEYVGTGTADIYPHVIENRTSSSFDVLLSGTLDDDYICHWFVRRDDSVFQGT